MAGSLSEAGANKTRVTIRGVSLPDKIWLGLMGVLFLAALGSGLALWSAARTGGMLRDIITDNSEQARAISSLEAALLEDQRRVLQAIADGGARYLDALTESRQWFERYLNESREIGLQPSEETLLNDIAVGLDSYVQARSEMLAGVKRGDSLEAKNPLLTRLREEYEHVHQLCEALSEENGQYIRATIRDRQAQTLRQNILAGVSVLLVIALAAGFFRLFLGGVFHPISQLAKDAQTLAPSDAELAPRNEIDALERYFQLLKSDLADARLSVEQGQRLLLDAEKLAAVGRIAAGVAHEIRSPLTALKLRLFSMQKSLGNFSEQDADLRLMSEEITRLDNIIRNFLEFSRTPEVRVQRGDVSTVLDKVVDFLQFKAKASNVHLLRQDSDDLPEVLIDPHQMRQVFLNLLNNAVEALPDGGEVCVKAAQGDIAGKPYVTIQVCDTGPGVPERVLDRLFEPFVTTKECGTGLGLWVARRIAIQHGGELELTSSSSKGAVFTVSIPIEPPPCGAAYGDLGNV